MVPHTQRPVHPSNFPKRFTETYEFFQVSKGVRGGKWLRFTLTVSKPIDSRRPVFCVCSGGSG